MLTARGSGFRYNSSNGIVKVPQFPNEAIPKFSNALKPCMQFICCQAKPAKALCTAHQNLSIHLFRRIHDRKKTHGL